MFKSGVTPDDIVQGALGDCYLLAVLSSLAEEEQAIKARFITKTVNKAGIYLMTFFINGVETPVVVDDFVPSRRGKPVFSTTKQEELWAILLEKGWAKLHGTYLRMEAGLPSFACMHLLGTPADSLWHGDANIINNPIEFFNKLKNFDNREYKMMSASKGQGENKGETGVISGHAYSLIAVKEFEAYG